MRTSLVSSAGRVVSVQNVVINSKIDWLLSRTVRLWTNSGFKDVFVNAVKVRFETFDDGCDFRGGWLYSDEFGAVREEDDFERRGWETSKERFKRSVIVEYRCWSVVEDVVDDRKQGNPCFSGEVRFRAEGSEETLDFLVDTFNATIGPWGIHSSEVVLNEETLR